MKRVYVVVGEKLVDITHPAKIETPPMPGVPEEVWAEIDQHEEWFRNMFVPKGYALTWGADAPSGGIRGG